MFLTMKACGLAAVCLLFVVSASYASQRVPVIGDSVGDVVGTAGQSANWRHVVAWLLRHGEDPTHAYGEALAAFSESKLDPRARLIDKTGEAYGIGQWRGPRLARLRAMFGKRPTLDQQLRFLLLELRGGGDVGGAAVESQSTLSDVIKSYIHNFMRPSGPAELGDLSRSGLLGSAASPAAVIAGAGAF
jgi:Phage tail lysozyme